MGAGVAPMPDPPALAREGGTVVSKKSSGRVGGLVKKGVPPGAARKIAGVPPKSGGSKKK